MHIINQSLIYLLGTLVLISADAVSSSSINTETKKLRGSSGNSIATADMMVNDDATSSTSNVRLLQETSKECTLQAVSYMEIPGQTIEGGGTHIHCEIEDDDMNIGIMHEIQGNDKQMEKLIDMFETGKLLVGESSITIDDDSVAEDTASGAMILSSQFNAKKKVHNKASSPWNQRRLNNGGTVGTKPVLAVKIIDVDGVQVSDSPAQISDDIFGTNNDPINVVSQFSACSMGKLTIVPGQLPNGVAPSVMPFPGVITVNLNIPLNGSTDGDILNAAKTAVKIKLGLNSLPGPYQQIMFIKKGCYPTQCPYAAYAYYNRWDSVYREPYHKHVSLCVSVCNLYIGMWIPHISLTPFFLFSQPAVVIHELGHNFNLAHSGGLNGATYTE